MRGEHEKAYWYRPRKGRLSPAGFMAWRKTIPFTNKQLADAITAEAEAAPTWFVRQKYLDLAIQVAKGYVSAARVRLALPRLVTLCGICGKTALYRYESEGRCSAHRLDVPSAAMAARARLDAKSVDIDINRRRTDANDKFKAFIRGKKAGGPRIGHGS